MESCHHHSGAKVERELLAARHRFGGLYQVPRLLIDCIQTFAIVKVDVGGVRRQRQRRNVGLLRPHLLPGRGLMVFVNCPAASFINATPSGELPQEPSHVGDQTPQLGILFLDFAANPTVQLQ